jgi:hypothetical protein
MTCLDVVRHCAGDPEPNLINWMGGLEHWRLADDESTLGVADLFESCYSGPFSRGYATGGFTAPMAGGRSWRGRRAIRREPS